MAPYLLGGLWGLFTIQVFGYHGHYIKAIFEGLFAPVGENFEATYHMEELVTILCRLGWTYKICMLKEYHVLVRCILTFCHGGFKVKCYAIRFFMEYDNK